MVIMAMEMRQLHMMDEIYKPVQMKIVNTHKRTYDHYNPISFLVNLRLIKALITLILWNFLVALKVEA